MNNLKNININLKKTLSKPTNMLDKNISFFQDNIKNKNQIILHLNNEIKK